MKNIILSTLLLFLLSPIFLSAQIQNGFLSPGYASTGVGLGKYFPGFKKAVDTKAWTAFSLKSRLLEVEYAWGDFTYGEIGTEDYVSDGGTLMNLGINIPFHKWTPLRRKNYWTGLQVVPSLGVHYSFQTMGRTNGNNIRQHGINLAPGLSFQLPAVMFDIKLNTGLYFGGNDVVKTQMDKYRGALLFSPSIGIKIDGLYEHLGGRVSKAGSYYYTYKVLTDYESEVDDYGYRTTREYFDIYESSGDKYVTVQKAFWYLSASWNKGSDLVMQYSDERETRNIPTGNGWGLGLGGRWKGLMADVSLERNASFYAIRDPEFIKELEGMSKEFPLVEGYFSALEIRGKVGFDILSAIGGIVAPQRARAMKNLDGHWVKFTRLNGGVSGGYAIPGKTKMITDEGDALLDEFFASHPDIERNYKTDIQDNKTAWVIGLFLNWEMGPISFEFDWHGNHDFGWRSSFGVRYMIPMNVLFSQ